MSLYDLVASLPLKIEGYSLEGLARTVSSGFERKSTIFVLQGAGEEGRGEDVTYEAGAHDAQQAAGPVLDLAGEYTFGSLPVSPYDARSLPKLRRPRCSVLPSAFVNVHARLALGYDARGLLAPNVEKPSFRIAPLRYS